MAQSLKLKSVRTEKNYEGALKGVTVFLKEQRNNSCLTGLTKAQAESYLEKRSKEVGQKTLDMDRQAMQAALGEKLQGEKLRVVKSELEIALESRAYTTQQVAMVASAQSARHALATLIAENAGLRAHELFTLRPVDERAADTHREYREDRFLGRENIVIYTVEGKGGLCREVGIDKNLIDRLEERRLPQPRTIFDREVKYQTLYDIGGGQKWSNSFSSASKRVLGWSNGAHGVRHEFAQQRMNTLQQNGFEYKEALEVVSQEMGHFRADITEVYLR